MLPFSCSINRYKKIFFYYILIEFFTTVFSFIMLDLCIIKSKKKIMKKKETILVIESERIVSMEIKMELELKGYSVVQSDSLNNVLKIKDQPIFKAIIIDID